MGSGKDILKFFGLILVVFTLGWTFLVCALLGWYVFNKLKEKNQLYVSVIGGIVSAVVGFVIISVLLAYFL